MTATQYPTKKVLLGYTLFGGMIGGLLHLLSLNWFPMGDDLQIFRHVGLSLADFGKAIIAAMLFGTFFGIVPACMTACTLGVRKSVLVKISDYLTVFAIGFISTFLFFVLFFHDLYALFTLDDYRFLFGVINFNARFAWIGGLSSVVIASCVLPKVNFNQENEK